MSPTEHDSDNRSAPQFSILSILVLTVILAPCFVAYRYGGFAASLRMAIAVGVAWTMICFIRLLLTGRRGLRIAPDRAAKPRPENAEELEP